MSIFATKGRDQEADKNLIMLAFMLAGSKVPHKFIVKAEQAMRARNCRGCRRTRCRRVMA